jgi:hypothetical protein
MVEGVLLGGFFLTPCLNSMKNQDILSWRFRTAESMPLTWAGIIDGFGRPCYGPKKFVLWTNEGLFGPSERLKKGSMGPS